MVTHLWALHGTLCTRVRPESLYLLFNFELLQKKRYTNGYYYYYFDFKQLVHSVAAQVELFYYLSDRFENM